MGIVLTTIAKIRNSKQALHPTDPNPPTSLQEPAPVSNMPSQSPVSTPTYSTPTIRIIQTAEMTSTSETEQTEQTEQMGHTDQTEQTENRSQRRTKMQLEKAETARPIEDVHRIDRSVQFPSSENSLDNGHYYASVTASSVHMRQGSESTSSKDQSSFQTNDHSHLLRPSQKSRFKRGHVRRQVFHKISHADRKLIGRLIQIPWNADFCHLWVDCDVVAYNPSHNGLPIHCLRFVDGFTEWRHLTYYREVHDSSPSPSA